MCYTAALKPPKIEEGEVKPYTPKELEAIMVAVEEYPNWGIHKSNTRARVRAFILILRWSGIRIGDAIQLSREKVSAGKLTCARKRMASASQFRCTPTSRKP
jgi:integrase